MRPRLPRVDGLHGHAARRAERDVAGRAIGGGHPEVGEFTAGERAVAVHALDHLALGRKVLVAPQPHRRKRADVAPRVRHQVFGADHTPAAFGLDLAHRGRGERRAVAGAVAVGDLVEAVRRRHRADAHRLEQHVEAWVSRHRGVFAPPPRPRPPACGTREPGRRTPAAAFRMPEVHRRRDAAYANHQRSAMRRPSRSMLPPTTGPCATLSE